MTRLLFLCVITVCAVAIGAIVLSFFAPQKRSDAALHDLTWTVTNDVLTFDFEVTNLTNENLRIRVDLIAELRVPSDTEPEISTVGQKSVEIILNAQQKKLEHGQMSLIGKKGVRLTLSPFITVQKVAGLGETKSGSDR